MRWPSANKNHRLTLVGPDGGFSFISSWWQRGYLQFLSTLSCSHSSARNHRSARSSTRARSSRNRGDGGTGHRASRECGSEEHSKARSSSRLRSHRWAQPRSSLAREHSNWAQEHSTRALRRSSSARSSLPRSNCCRDCTDDRTDASERKDDDRKDRSSPSRIHRWAQQHSNWAHNHTTVHIHSSAHNNHHRTARSRRRRFGRWRARGRRLGTATPKRHDSSFQTLLKKYTGGEGNTNSTSQRQHSRQARAASVVAPHSAWCRLASPDNLGLKRRVCHFVHQPYRQPYLPLFANRHIFRFLPRLAQQC